MSLSTYMAAHAHRALGVTTANPVRLAIALGVIKDVVRVVDRSLVPMAVQWSEHDPDNTRGSSSFTDFRNGTININPSPMLDTGIDHSIALDICLGFGLHEAAHSQESRDRYRYLVTRAEDGQELPAFEPMRVAAYLWNLVEDVRIERVTAQHWPGFAKFFGAVLRYMWTQMRRKHELPTEYGSKIEDRMKVVFLACRYPAQFSPTDPALVAEVAWWQAWQHDYLSDAVDTTTTIQRGLDHLAEDEATAADLRGAANAERKEREAGERLRDQINRLIREGVGEFEVCVADNGETIPLDEKTAEAVRQLVREGLIEHRTVVTVDGVSNAPVFVRKPEETTASRRAYIGRPDATVEALRAALVFRPSAPQHTEKLLRSGEIDDEELYRWGMGDSRVFGARVIESKPEVFMGLLVDASGSMYGRKLKTAQRLAQLLVWATHDQEGIETAVWAHTADVDGRNAQVYRIWERGDPLSRLGLIAEMPHSNNRDGQIVEWTTTQIERASQPEKVLVVLSDGIPQAQGLGDRSAMNHVRAVVRRAASHGVRVIQIAIDDDLRPNEQSAMYGADWLPYRSDAELPKQLTALIGRYLS